MESFINNVYFITLILCFIFSIGASIILYNRDKYKLISLSEKFKNGWGLYKVKFKKIENNFVISPNTKDECLYYYANLKYEERVDNIVGKKKKVDTKYLPKNNEKHYHNEVLLSILDKDIKINTDKLILSLDKTIDDNPNVSLEENQKILYLEEAFIKEDEDYYALVEIKNKNINTNDIKISNDISDFKYSFYFHLGLLWFPTLAFLGTYYFII